MTERHVVKLIDSGGNEFDFDWHGLAVERGKEIEFFTRNSARNAALP
jgi:hypothetical protein